MYPVPMHFSAYVDKKDKMAYSDPYNGQSVGLKRYKKVFIQWKYKQTQ